MIFLFVSVARFSASPSALVDAAESRCVPLYQLLIVCSGSLFVFFSCVRLFRLQVFFSTALPAVWCVCAFCNYFRSPFFSGSLCQPALPLNKRRVRISRETYRRGYNEIHLKSHRAPYPFGIFFFVLCYCCCCHTVVVVVVVVPMHNYREQFNLHKIPNEAFIPLAVCDSRK